MAFKTYKGKFLVTKPEKYAGDVNKVTYRSGWEKAAMRWCEANNNIVKWNSETLIIPYICATDNRPHKYYTDLMFQTKDGKIYVIEIKPNKQTKPPKGVRKTKRLITETLTYAKNISKWKAAKVYCDQREWQFEIWDEYVLKRLGIPIVNKH